MEINIKADVSITITADLLTVWDALTKPEMVKEWFLALICPQHGNPAPQLLLQVSGKEKNMKTRELCLLTQTLKCCNTLTGAV